MTLSLSEIASMLGCAAPVGGARTISGMASLAEAKESEISLLGAENYLPDFSATRAAAVIVKKGLKLPADHGRIVFIVDDADLAQAKVLEKFAPAGSRPLAGIDDSARIAPSADIDPTASIGPHVVIGQRSRVGRGTTLHAGVVIADDVLIGEQCELFPYVVIRDRVTVGSRVIIQAGSVIGSDGFGFRRDGAKHIRIPHIGTVIIEDDVEIGACVCIDRAKFSATRVGRGTKIDNQVQIGHNVSIGENCVIVGQVGIAGSARLGANVILGGQAAVRDHITIGDGAMAAACAAIMGDVEPKSIVSGYPAFPHRQSLREQAALRRLPDLVVQVRKLEEEVAKLRGQKGLGVE